jgi:phytanoyl-CoA hydroxylase
MSARKAKVFKSLVQGPSGLCFSGEQLNFFKTHGYLAIEQFFTVKVVESVRNRFQLMFDGKFDTGVYPDEWYGRTGMCTPNMTREICNGWKSDRTIAQLALSSELHKLSAQLHGWNSSRIAQDDVLLKPRSGGTPVEFHRDGIYISDQFDPSHDNSITIWIPLNDVGIETGTIEYVPGSHLWLHTSLESTFHSSAAMLSPESHRVNFLQNLRHNVGLGGSPNVTFEYVEIPKGGIVFHHQNTFHGSGWNQSGDSDRCAMVVHSLKGDCQFTSERAISYIYGRYKMHDETSGEELLHLHERFFPICWSGNCRQERSKWLDTLCEDSIRWRHSETHSAQLDYDIL